MKKKKKEDGLVTDQNVHNCWIWVMGIRGLLLTVFENFIIIYLKYLDQQHQRGFNGSGVVGDDCLQHVCPLSYTSLVWLASSCGIPLGVLCCLTLPGPLLLVYSLVKDILRELLKKRFMECEFLRSQIPENVCVLFSYLINSLGS